MKLVHGLLIAAASLVALVALGVAGAAGLAGFVAWESSDHCPQPQFANPPKVVWSGTTLVAGDGGGGPDGGGGAPAEVFVVSWAASRGDPLPASYYETPKFYVSDAGTSVVTAKHLGPRTIAVQIQRGPSEPAPRSQVGVSLRYGDTRGAVTCSHPGMPDSYGVSLVMDIDWATRTATASFGEVSMHAGACGVGGVGTPTGGAGRGVLLVALLAGVAAWRRRRNGGPNGQLAGSLATATHSTPFSPRARAYIASISTT